MAVHRISDAAEQALDKICELEGRIKRDVLHDLIVGYWRGMSFDHPPHPSDDGDAMGSMMGRNE